MVLSEVFNRMLERIETERRDSGRRMLAAQERERRRVARELHDEVGQTVTALMLEVGQAADDSPEPQAARLREIQDAARQLGGDLQRIVRHLRPDALDDLGLASALTHLSQVFSDRFGVPVVRDLTTDLPDLEPAVELVVYRVAQESLTNVGRHADARLVDLSFTRHGDTLLLSVSDDGIGIDGSAAGSGIRGMRERALLLNADLIIDSEPDEGTTVRLEVPLGEST